jgi:protein gp37
MPLSAIEWTDATWNPTTGCNKISFGVPFFFKQWGGVRKKQTGRELDGRTWDEMPTHFTTQAQLSNGLNER